MEALSPLTNHLPYLRSIRVLANGFIFYTAGSYSGGFFFYAEGRWNSPKNIARCLSRSAGGKSNRTIFHERLNRMTLCIRRNRIILWGLKGYTLATFRLLAWSVRFSWWSSGIWRPQVFSRSHFDAEPRATDLRKRFRSPCRMYSNTMARGSPSVHTP